MATGRSASSSATLLILLLIMLPKPMVFSPNELEQFRDGQFTGILIGNDATAPLQNSTTAVTRPKTRRAKHFLHSRILYTNNGTSTFQLERNLLVCGDISSNPGPRRRPTKYLCDACGSNIRNNQRTILCSSCDTRSHLKCLQLSKGMIQHYKTHPDTDWTCYRCALPDLNNSFFERSQDELNVSNYTDTSKHADESRLNEQNEQDSICWFEENIGSYYKSNLKIAYLNINSIHNKIDEVKHMLNRNLFDIMFIAETKLDNTVSDALLDQPGYKKIRRDRKKGAGGLIAYIGDNVTAYRRRKLEPENVESICLDVKDAKNARFIVCACYRSPGKCKETDFISSLSNATETMYRTRNEVLLLGDFNMDMFHNEATGRIPNQILSDFCRRYCLENKISEPTRVTNKSSTLIDVILASHQDRYAFSGTLHLGISDHDLIYTIRKSKLPRPTPRTIEYRSLKNLDENSLIADLKYVPWHSAFIYNNADDVLHHWSTLYKEVLDQHAPKKNKRIRSDQLPWITPAITREISRRNRLFKKHKKNPTIDSWEVYKLQRNKVTAMKRKGMRAFCHNATANVKHHGEFWKKMSPLLPNNNKGRTTGRVVLIENDEIVAEPNHIAEIFNDYFVDMADCNGNDKKVEDFNSHPSIGAIIQRHPPLNQFTFHTVDEEYIRKILNNLEPKKSVGADDISPRLLKLSAPAISNAVTDLINHFIISQTWPAQWKSSNISPVHKKSDETDKRNYRPVSVLSALSKIYEKVVFDQIYSILQPHISSNLSGFLKGHSCCPALLKMSDDWRRNLDGGKCVAAIAIDLSKAFDSVCHNLMLAKLKAYGFSEAGIDLMKAYLHNRHQRVKVNGTFSDWKTVRRGLPQGSLLGPLFFNIFINDINFFIDNVSLRLYADDTTEYFADESPMVLEFVINTELETISNWFASNYLTVNNQKTQAMSIGPSKYAHSLKISESSIEVKDSLRILGVTMDAMLTFKPHIKEQLTKAYAKCSALRRIRRFIEPEVMIRLYKAFILPHLEYCSPLLVGIAKTQVNKLEDANHFILRSILGLSKNTDYTSVLRHARMQSLTQRKLAHSLVLLYKCLKEKGPKYIKDFFNLRETRYNLRGTGTKLEQLPFRTKWLKNSFGHIASRLWNKLPKHLREADNLAHFKKLLKMEELNENIYCA